MPSQKKPTQQKNSLDKKQIATIIAKYPIREWEEAPNLKLRNSQKPIRKILGSTAFKTGILADHKFYILKEAPWYCSNPEFIRNAILFQTLLRWNGLPVPEILTANNSNRFVSILVGEGDTSKIYTLQRFVDGFAWMGGVKQIQNAGLMLGKLHTISQRLFKIPDCKLPRKIYSSKIFSCSSPKPNLPRENIFDNLDNMLGFAYAEILEKNHGELSESASEELNKFIEFCKQDLKEIKKQAIKNGYIDLQIAIHGDFNPTNWIFDQNKIIGIIDFDNCCIENPIRDVLQAILHFCYFIFKENSSEFSAIPDQFEENEAFLFLQAYFKYSFICPDDVRSYIGLATRAVTMELCLLGLLKLNFSLGDCNKLPAVLENAERVVNRIISNFSHSDKPKAYIRSSL